MARENGPKRLVTEAEVHFEEGPPVGARLVGFWRRYFDYLRAIDGNGETVKRVKAWILDEYRKVEAAA